MQSMLPWLYLAPLIFVQIGYVFFAAIFLVLRRRSRAKTRKSDPASIVAILIQALGFVLVWANARKPFTPFLPIGWRGQFLIACLIVFLVIASLVFINSAVAALGKQWSLQARVVADHELIRRGPYRVVRHPIYAGMFGMLVAGGLAFGHWIGLLLGSLVYWLGTVVRVRSEERLLREQFGTAYTDYMRAVPAFLPLRFWSNRRHLSGHTAA